MEEKIINLFKLGKSRKEIIKELCIPNYQISNVLKKYKLQPTKNRITIEEFNELKKLVEEGLGFIKACDTINRSSTAVKDFALKNNLSLDFLPQKSRPWSEEELTKLKELVTAGTPYREIAKELRREVSGVARKLKDIGFSSKSALKLEINRNLLKDEKAKCGRCQRILPFSEYYQDISKRICKECCKKRENLRRRAQRNDPISYIRKRISEAKGRSVKNSYEFDLTIDWFKTQIDKQNGKCYYSGKELFIGANNLFAASIDRKDSKLGYTQDNCVLCGWKINNMKNDLSIEEFIELCKLVSQHKLL